MSNRTSKSASSGPELSRRGPSWPSRAVPGLAAIAFALFVRVTLYGRVELMEPGPKGILIPVAILLSLVAWYRVARGLIARAATPSELGGGLAALTFAPLLATLPISLQVLLSEDFAREYWIDRSLKVELLLGLPALVLALQVGTWIWFRFRLTWRGAGAVLLVLAAALGLRWAGMGWGLPFAFQPEESSIYVRWAIEFALHGQWNPHYFQNPSLLIYLLGIEFSGIFALARVLQFGQDPGDLYMVFRGEQDLFYGLARLNSVLLGTATVFVVYLIGRRLWGEWSGIVSAAFLAVNFLHVRNSQYAVNDVPSTFFLVLSFYFVLDIVKRGGRRDYLLAGLMAGLAASTKYNAGMAVVPILVGHWLRRGAQHAGGGAGPGRGGMPGVAVWRESVAARRWWSSPEDPRLVIAGLAAALGFVLGTPFSILDFNGFRQGFLEQLEMGSSAWSGQALEPTAVQFVAGVVHGSGVLISLLALLGAFSMLTRGRRDGWLLLSFALPYFLVMSSMALFFVRWVVPVMPFVSLMAAYGVQEVGKTLPARRLGWLAVALVALAILQPAVFSLRLDWLANQVDTRQEANRWAETAIPPGSKVAVEAFSLLDQESLAFRATLQQREIELDWRATMHDLDYYRRNGFDFLAISSFMYDRAFEQPEKYADRVEFYQRLDREYPLVAVFSPRNDGGPAPYALDDLDTPFWHLFAYDRPGPTVKVYRIGAR